MQFEADRPIQRITPVAPPNAVARWLQIVPPGPLAPAWCEILRITKYGIVGMTNTVVSMLVLNAFFFVIAPQSQAILVAGTTLAYFAGDLNSYWWNSRWTFGAGRASWLHFARFMVISVVAMAINAAIVWSSSGFLLTLPIPDWLLANIYQISMILSGSLGYLACRFWVFKGAARNSPARE
ncbi:MAG: GtrA family protein [Chloroflexota bacterium]